MKLQPLLLSYFLAALAINPSAIANDVPKGMDWVPPQAMGDGLRAEEADQLVLPVTVTPTPKATADISKFAKEYQIELSKFGIFNDGTHAAETSKGLNEALQDAKTVGANRIVFPPGTYLISETDPVVLDLKDTIVDLNGATLQIQTNGLQKYSVVSIVFGADNLRLTNGTLRGDRDTHDYKTTPGTHEWGAGIHFISGKNLEIDHLTFTNMTGDGVSSGATGNRDRTELLGMIKHTVARRDLESGGFSETGEKIPSTESVRTIKPYDMTKCGGEFELGYMAGYQGFPFIKGRSYDVYFLDESGSLIEKRKVPQYRKTSIPDGAKTANFEFNQPDVPEKAVHAGAGEGWLVRITNFHPSTDVHFHHNISTGNRRLGMAFCGGQRWVIEENRFENNKGTNPACGVDFEDGFELMQDVVFRKNSFQGNGNGDFVLCAGSEIIVEDNTFEKSVLTWGRPNNYTFRNNTYSGGNVEYVTRTGVAKIHNNTYSNCKLTVRFDTKGVADGIVRNEGEKVSTPALMLVNEKMDNMKSVTGTYLNFKDCTFDKTPFVAGKETRLVRFDGCKFTDSTLQIEVKGPDFVFDLKNNTGDLPIDGPGIQRKLVSGN